VLNTTADFSEEFLESGPGHRERMNFGTRTTMTPLHRAVSVALVVAVACTATATEQKGVKAANPNNAAMDFEKRLKGNE